MGNGMEKLYALRHAKQLVEPTTVIATVKMLTEFFGNCYAES